MKLVLVNIFRDLQGEYDYLIDKLAQKTARMLDRTRIAL